MNKICKECGKPEHKYLSTKCKKCKDCGKTIHHQSTRCQTCSNTGKNNPMFGKKRPEHSKKISGKNHPFYGKKRPDIKKRMTGKNNPSYIHGKAYFKYSRKFNESLKKSIKIRDNYICQNCGMTQEEHYKKYNRDIEIHHIDYDRENCDKNNLITLCKDCNLKANYNRKYWVKYFQNKLIQVL